MFVRHGGSLPVQLEVVADASSCNSPSVHTGTTNLVVGLVFLQPRLLIVDEGTSACDAASDALLQQTLRVAFPGCTVFTIAHRMATILDSSTIVVIRWVGAFATQA